jgi:diadenosine tetraphosphatase ApaH/serine/threonine PP2A family protein phosphatase
MKIALITDLHANREAVAAVLDDARQRGAQRYVFLGDFVGYGSDPGWVVDRVRELVDQGALAVMGNHDEAVVKGPRAGMIPEARWVAEWTRAQLDAGQLDFLAALPLCVVEDDTLYVHANAQAPGEWGYIEGRSEAVRSLQAVTQRFIFCGHVHEPKLFHLSPAGKAGDFLPTPNVPIPLSPQRRWLAIPGSAGQPRDGNPAVCYATFDLPEATLTFHRVAYDHELAAAKVRQAGLPEALALRLIRGT